MCAHAQACRICQRCDNFPILIDAARELAYKLLPPLAKRAMDQAKERIEANDFRNALELLVCPEKSPGPILLSNSSPPVAQSPICPHIATLVFPHMTGYIVGTSKVGGRSERGGHKHNFLYALHRRMHGAVQAGRRLHHDPCRRGARG